MDLVQTGPLAWGAVVAAQRGFVGCGLVLLAANCGYYVQLAL